MEHKLTPQSLRIGNLVLYSDKNETPTPTTIHIGVSDLILLSNNVKDVIYQPIPLTEEWLLKFGFETTYSSNFRLKFDHPLHNEIGYDFSHNAYKSMEGFRYYGKYIKIQYVHQLQNLYFALTNEELTIR